jgi:hypothetical protein
VTKYDVTEMTPLERAMEEYGSLIMGMESALERVDALLRRAKEVYEELKGELDDL